MNKRICSAVFMFLFLVIVTVHGMEPSKPVEFTILHTSDIHAHLMSFDNAMGEGIGGYARIKAYKDSLEKQGQNILMLSSGDLFQGTYFYRFFQGIPDIQFMNDTGYSAMTLGNHEFDNGQPALAEALSHANFPVLAANILFRKKIPELSAKLKPYIFLKVGKGERRAKIAVIGLVPEELKNIVQPLFVEDIIVTDAVSALRKHLPNIKKQKPDMILVLSHLGWDREVEIFERFPEIDGILGGHTHLAVDAPAVVVGMRGHRFMSEPGEFGQYVTRYDISYSPSEVRKVKVLSAALVPMLADLPEDDTIAAAVAHLWEQIKEKVFTPIATANVFLDGERNSIRNYETNLGNFIADSFVEISGAEMCLVNGGGIRSSISVGQITIGDCLNVLPFENYLQKLYINGRSIKKVFSQVAHEVSKTSGFGGFLQISKGLFVDYTQTPPTVEFQGKPLKDDELYSVVTIDFLASGGNGLTAFTEAERIESTGITTADAFIQYVTTQKVLAPTIEGRINAMKPIKKHFKMPKGIVKSIPKLLNTYRLR